MKAIKLIITFVVLLALVVLAFYIVPRKVDPPVLLDPPDETLKEMRTQIERDWEQANDWDEKVFAKHCDKLNKMKKDYSVGTLVDMNTRLAVETGAAFSSCVALPRASQTALRPPRSPHR